MSFKTVVLDGLDLRIAIPDNIYVGFVVRLPFRFRVGPLYQMRYEHQDSQFELWLRNRTDIPAGNDAITAMASANQQADLWTDALIVLESPESRARILSEIKNIDPENDRARHAIFYCGDALAALNHFTVAYATAVDTNSGGRPLHVLGYSELLEHYLQTEFTIVKNQGSLTPEQVLALIDTKPTIPLSTNSTVWGDLDDVPPDKLRAIGHTMNLQERYLFYELAFSAKSRYHAKGDLVGALLTAVAALEGVHAAFVHIVLSEKLPASSQKELSEDFLRSLGMSLCIRLTPYLLMSPLERPSLELIEDCILALRIRNEIMHALQNKRGEYRIRSRTDRSLEVALLAVLGVYDAIRVALEGRLAS